MTDHPPLSPLPLPRRRWGPLVLGPLVGLMGLLNIYSALVISSRARLRWLRQLLPLEIITGSRSVTVLAGFLLLALTGGIFRGKRTAWYAVAVTVQLSVIAHLAKSLDWVEALAGMFLMELLLWFRTDFRAGSDRPSLVRGLIAFTLGVGAAFAYTVAGLYLLDSQFHIQLSLRAAVAEAYALLLSPTPVLLEPASGVARWFIHSLFWIDGAMLVYSVTLLLRPVVYRASTLRHEREQAAALAEQWGRSSLTFFTLWPDKIYFFSPSHRSYVAYRLVGDVAVALGDPVGPPEEAEVKECVRSFLEMAETNGWVPAFYQTLPDWLKVYRELGLSVMRVGDEAVVPLADFSLAGGAKKSLRQAYQRMLRSGWRVEFYDPPLDDSLVAELQRISHAWLSGKQGGERTFSLGYFTPEYVRTTPVAVARRADGEAVAFLNFQPMYRLHQICPDLMRRLPDVGVEEGKDGKDEQGEGSAAVMDLLMVETALKGQREGYEALNLGLAPLANVGIGADAQLPERVARFLYKNFNRFYNFQGLHRFKAKFGPVWEPRFLVYPGSAVLPKVVVAVVRADATTSLGRYTWDGAALLARRLYRRVRHRLLVGSREPGRRI